MITCAIIGAGGRGKDAYAPYMKKHPEQFMIKAVAECDKKRREEFAKEFEIPPEMCFESYEEFFKKPKMCDCVLICTQDKQHFEPAMTAMNKGYHIYLEKPVSSDIDELKMLKSKAEEYDKLFMTGYVLRYTPFFMKIRDLLENGAIGTVVSVQHNENEGWWHHAHSYVRGPWSNSEKSSPLILAKSCHDMDLLLCIAGAPCKSISSYGSNLFFRPENAPENSGNRCFECRAAKNCKYNACTAYTKGDAKYFAHLLGRNDKEVLETLKTSPYGRCVFKCDNNVPDHQVASMEFENGITAVFTVCAFTEKNTRTIKIMGTEGEIGGCMEEGEIIVRRFGGETQSIKVTNDGSRHCGGDSGIMNKLYERISGEDIAFDSKIFDSHIIALAAEQSRIERKTENIEDFKKKYFNTEDCKQ